MNASRRRKETIAELRPYVERARTFSGWSLADIKVTHLEPQPPWDYEGIVRERLAGASSVLDLGTGGAELFARVVEGFAGRIVATEEWHVNAPIARDALSPLGGSLVRAAVERAIPFREAAFDLIIDRHEAIDPAEVARVLAPGGTFITQQIGGDEWRELSPHFPNRARWPDHYSIYQDGLRAAGLELTAQHHSWRIAYETLGDIVFMLLVSPWEIPGFDPLRDLDNLLSLEDACRTDRGLEMTWSRYLITAHKPG
jgi:SAM-dependent methyltransferase